MRYLPLVLALILAIPATAVVAFPRAMPDGAPVFVPTAGEDSTGDAHEHEEHATRAEHEAPHEPAAAPGSAPAHQHGRERTVWPAAEGTIPASTDGLVEVRNVLIEGAPRASELKELGIEVAGSGTLADPYVIEGLYVTNELEIKDTDAYYVIRENVIAGTLRLNWNDDRVHVHHNDVRDLRVNENIERKGEATGGLIELNRFGVVGQIRHYDGVFRANEVGPIPVGLFDDVIEDSGLAMPFFAEPRALNIDGFDGAVFEENVILGYVEMQLHGHHHASCFACHSHNHAVERAMKHDHTIRYHEAVFRANTITVDEGVAFRYTDAGHSGDDRTARSEPNEDLEKAHVHFTSLDISDNLVTGGPMVVDILNADSRDHANEETEDVEPVAVHPLHAYRAQLTLARNEVAWTLPETPLAVPWLDDAIGDGILVRDAKEAWIDVDGNVVTLTGEARASPISMLPLFGQALGGDAPAALHMLDVRSAHVVVAGNHLAGGHYGILAQRFADDAAWTLGENAFSGEREEVEHDAESAPSRG